MEEDRVADNFDGTHDEVDTSLTLAPPGSNPRQPRHPPASGLYEELTGIANAYLSSGNQANNNNNSNAPTLPTVGLNHSWYSHGHNVDRFSNMSYYDYREGYNNVPFHDIDDRPYGGIRMRANLPNGIRVCGRCGTTTTPMWRRGPDGPQTHCNACGLWYARLCKAVTRRV